MISQVPRQLEFGNPAHIALVDEWQALNDAEREMLVRVEQIDGIELLVRLQGAVYDVYHFVGEKPAGEVSAPGAEHVPAVITRTTDIDDVPNVIDDFLPEWRRVNWSHV